MDTELRWYSYGAPSRQRVATRGFRALKKRPWIIPAVLSVGAGLLILAVGWPAKDKK
jgi:hypothetical protein